MEITILDTCVVLEYCSWKQNNTVALEAEPVNFPRRALTFPIVLECTYCACGARSGCRKTARRHQEVGENGKYTEDSCESTWPWPGEAVYSPARINYGNTPSYTPAREQILSSSAEENVPNPVQRGTFHTVDSRMDEKQQD